MRQIVLDTETTGLEWKKGNRIVEVGCVELIERRPTGSTFHRYFNPGREFEPGAQEVTGLTLEFLADKPLFADVVDEFLEFVAGAELVIHNAAFDIGFLDAELGHCGSHYGRMRDRVSVLELEPRTLQGSNHLHTAQVGVGVPDVVIGGRDAELRQPHDLTRLHTGAIGCGLSRVPAHRSTSSMRLGRPRPASASV